MAGPRGAAPADPRRGREDAWRSLTSEEFDLLVVGGGITGAGIASLAALRGLRVALLERDDWGAGTSGATSKMLHGGLRYLQHGDLRLVREALQERGRLLRALGPERVRVTPFLLPLRGGWGSRAKLRFGTWLYQRLSGELSLGPRSVLSRTETLSKVPALQPEGLHGGVLYPEGVVDDVLLTLWRVGEARTAGAVVLNHAEALAPRLEGERIRGAKVRDLVGGGEGEVRARAVINATGVAVGGWAGAGRTPALRPSKGVHLVFARSTLPLEVAVVLPAPAGRWVFALPYGPLTLVGTTDTDHPSTDLTRVRAEPEDVRYLLRVVNESFPSCRVSANEVRGVYAGLRPLLAGQGRERTTSELSREDVVHSDASGLLSVAGGKLTTHRAMAVRALASTGLASAGAGHGSVPSTGSTWEFPPRWSGTPCPGAEVLRAALLDPTGASSDLPAWVDSAVRVTGALSLADVMDRRFHGVQDLDPAFPRVVGEVARRMAPLLGWSEEVSRREREDYLERVRWRTQAVVDLRQEPSPSP